ncbi:MAG TPA: FG-GAP-like repeat-containing protein [Sphingomicrobium sp.]|nr:FG-GAP-like repeat-containing protein [Sphingomicrobium sp.]
MNKPGNRAYNTATPGDDVIYGTNGSDLIDAGDGNDTIFGLAGNDYLFGWHGNDVIDGGDGDDWIFGEGGTDILTGGAGNDIFGEYDQWLNGDTITDFSIGDVILIRDADISTFTFSLVGSTLTFTGAPTPTFTGGSMTLSGAAGAVLAASAHRDGGVQIVMTAAPTPDARNDFNGDGRSDLLLRHTDGTITNWLGQPNGGFASNHAVAVYALSNSWQVEATGDFNGDGRDDLLLRHSDGTITDWLGQPNGSFVSNHGALAYGLDNAWQVAGTGDFNGDGRDDLLLRHTDGTLTDWLGQPNGGFAANHAVAVYALSNSWQVEATGDFNGDGRDDLLLRHSDGTITDWLGQPNGSFASNDGALAYGLDNAWQVAGTGDFNGDGRDDLLLRHTDGTITNWLGGFYGGFASNDAWAVYALSNSWLVEMIGDFNGDGRDDPLLRHTDGSITDWLGQPNGGFASNQGALAYTLDNVWQIQPDMITP